MLSFRHKKQTNKNVVDITFKDTYNKSFTAYHYCYENSQIIFDYIGKSVRITQALKKNWKQVVFSNFHEVCHLKLDCESRSFVENDGI